MTLPSFDWQRPDDLDGALGAVAEGGVPYCGGTELLAAMRLGLVHAERLVSLRTVPELAGIRLEGDRLHIGATTTYRQVARDDQVRQSCPLLASVADQVGNVRVRATGTVGGNLAFAEPRSDLTTVLIALGGEVSLTDGERWRSVPVADFLLGPYEPDLGPEELLVHVEVAADAADAVAYRKITVTERPVVGAALVRLRSSGRWRLVVGAVGDEPLSLEVAQLGDLDVDAVADEVDVVADLSGSETYKRQLTRVVVGRCVQDVRTPPGGGW